MIVTGLLSVINGITRLDKDARATMLLNSYHKGDYSRDPHLHCAHSTQIIKRHESKPLFHELAQDMYEDKSLRTLSVDKQNLAREIGIEMQEFNWAPPGLLISGFALAIALILNRRPSKNS